MSSQDPRLYQRGPFRSNSRPLPTPASNVHPNEPPSLPPRRASPVKFTLDPDPTTPATLSSGFVPHWKRTLPASPTKTPDISVVRRGNTSPVRFQQISSPQASPTRENGNPFAHPGGNFPAITAGPSGNSSPPRSTSPERRPLPAAPNAAGPSSPFQRRPMSAFQQHSNGRIQGRNNAPTNFSTNMQRSQTVPPPRAISPLSAHDVDSDDSLGEPSAVNSSPQYGILDLPRSSPEHGIRDLPKSRYYTAQPSPQPPAMTHARAYSMPGHVQPLNEPHGGPSNYAPSLPQAPQTTSTSAFNTTSISRSPTVAHNNAQYPIHANAAQNGTSGQSLTFRLAALGLQEGTSNSNAASTSTQHRPEHQSVSAFSSVQANGKPWPANLPRLPRVPGSANAVQAPSHPTNIPQQPHVPQRVSMLPNPHASGQPAQSPTFISPRPNEFYTSPSRITHESLDDEPPVALHRRLGMQSPGQTPAPQPAQAGFQPHSPQPPQHVQPPVSRHQPLPHAPLPSPYQRPRPQSYQQPSPQQYPQQPPQPPSRPMSFHQSAQMTAVQRYQQAVAATQMATRQTSQPIPPGHAPAHPIQHTHSQPAIPNTRPFSQQQPQPQSHEVNRSQWMQRTPSQTPQTSGPPPSHQPLQRTQSQYQPPTPQPTIIPHPAPNQPPQSYPPPQQVAPPRNWQQTYSSQSQRNPQPNPPTQQRRPLPPPSAPTASYAPPHPPKTPKVESPAPKVPPIISISIDEDRRSPSIPMINVSGNDDDNNFGPMISVSGPEISISDGNEDEQPSSGGPSRPLRPPITHSPNPLCCGGCSNLIAYGRTVNAMGVRWHPDCFRCCKCDTLLEHISSYEAEGRAWCHLDYHESFAPRCYHCKTAIIEERFISLDDPALGKRAYHEHHFFCAECGDPFIDPSSTRKGELNVSGDGSFVDDDVGFTVYKGHPYCEACHVRLRMPKCKNCQKSIRENMQAVEALGGKWCYECFVCKSCRRPFETPSFFERNGDPFCENCFSVILRNEV